jgi:hypothetical protein
VSLPVAPVAAVASPADRQPICRPLGRGSTPPRGPDPLRTLFRRRSPDFQAAYEQRYAATFGRFRLPLISRAASAFGLCGDWSRGIARIRCPSCGFDRFRPFSCTSYLSLDGALRRLFPSCAQKRTLLVGEYLSEDLLLTLPHRQAVQWPALGFVWTIPKALRVFLRHDREVIEPKGTAVHRARRKLGLERGICRNLSRGAQKDPDEQERVD